MNVIITNIDEKILSWVAYSPDTRILPARSGRGFLIDCVSYMLGGDAPDRVYLRYLNDPTSLSKAIQGVASEVLGLLLCAAFGVEIRWIAHNVDAESRVFYPRLNRFRRWYVAKMSKQIFVLDPLLIPYAKSIFKTNSHKLDWTSFGVPAGASDPVGSRNYWEILAFAREQRLAAQRAGQVALVGLCLSSGGKKYLHIDLAERLLEDARRINYHVALVISGSANTGATAAQRDALNRLKWRSDVYVTDGYIEFNEKENREFFDFFWRINDDLSVPYTAYVAAWAGRPVLTTSDGFLGDLVRRYELGGVLDPGFGNIETELRELENWKGGRANQFLRERSWRIGAERLF